MISRLEHNRRQAAQRRARLSETNRRHTEALVIIPPEKWPQTRPGMATPKAVRIAAWQSNRFLVQVFQENSHIRISVNRTALAADGSGDWQDGITWDELQQIKNAIGYRDHCAMELYPPAGEVVNVANIRHLWLTPSAPPPACMWRKQP